MIEPTLLSDEDVLARVVAGDTAAFELLMRRHNQRLYRVARSVAHNDADAEEIVQETYVRAFTHLSRFEGRSSVATWLTRIAFHEALRRRRRRLRAAAAGELFARSQAFQTHKTEDAGMSDDTTARAVLTTALDTLPQASRTVLVLRLVQGLSTRETAACLRLSEEHVKVLLHRGKRLLRAKLGTSALEDLREQYAFGAERCDRVVESVFRRLREHPADGQPR